MKWLTTFLLIALSIAKPLTETEKVIQVDSKAFQQPSSNIQWTNFQLEGEEPAEKTADLMGTFFDNFESAQEGAEAGVQSWGHWRGGNGGGHFTQDCHNRGTLRYVEMECGHFAGRVRLHCMAGAMGYSGAGLGNGNGPYRHFHAPITKMLVGAGAYVDRVTFYGNRGGHKGHCGRSGGGGKYWCNAPNSEWSLCAISGKAGWWLDKWRCGWCHGPGQDMISANWWGSFDRKGWSKCPHGRAMHGMWRNTCQSLYCIEEVACGGSIFTHCRKANWWGSFDRKGWSMCHAHTWISGYWRNSCHHLYCLEEAWCCGHPSYQWGGQGDANWWGSFDRIGYSLTPQNSYMTGLWRNTCHAIYCIELAKFAYVKHKPINCAMSGWSGFGGCSRSCGGGYQSRTRRVVRHPAHGGHGCPGSSERRRCNTHACPVHCAVSGFGGWGSCNKSCGNGRCSRSRRITRHPAHGGNRCPGLIEYKSCNTHHCPVPCVVSSFGAWGTCSEKCGPGMQYRTRRITRSPAYNGKRCPHLREQRKCQIKHCPIHCKVSAWGNFSKCDKQCGPGSQYRTRTVTQGAAHGGSQCPGLKETRSCQIKPCPINCIQTAWSAFDKCTKTCGGGRQKRTRKTTRPAMHGGKACGDVEESQDCNKHNCPIPCKLSGWSSPTTCSKECGGGVQTQTKQILQKPMYGGEKCPPTSRTLKCNEQPCPIAGGYSEFGKWSACSKICQGGIERRERTCTKPKPQYGGKGCEGANYEENACNTMHCSSITNCADAKLIYVKTMADLDARIGVCNKNLAAFNSLIKVADAELAAAKQLLAALNKLKDGSIKSKLVKIVEDSIKAGGTKLAGLNGKKTAEEKELALQNERKNKLAHTNTKCECDAKRNLLTPLVDKAEAQMRVNDKAIKDHVDAKTVLDKQLAGFVNALNSFALLPKALKDSMSALFKKLETQVKAEAAILDKKIVNLRKRNQMLLAKVQGWKKELSDCDKAVQDAASKLKKLLEEFEMEYIMEQVNFGEFYYNYREFTDTDMQDFHEEVLASSHFVMNEEETTTTTAEVQNVSTASYAEYGISGFMVLGGIFAFVAGRRQKRKSDEYTPLFE